jgi:hypothetical protein
MRSRIILLVLFIALLLSACRWVNWDVKITPTLTPTPTSTPLILRLPTITSTPTPEFYPVCTPPLCAIGTSEVYSCSATCPNGCGTTCATYTPTPKP